ncbi:MAG: helix-turn-helix domain-containing protein [Agathobacter sp.]|nr:helix-turn-helix domain-containing protein [Agathobacter sp.]
MSFTSEKSPFYKIAYITLMNQASRPVLDYNFFLILDGSLRVTHDKNTYFLQKHDIFLCEPGQDYQLLGTESNVILSIVVDRQFFQKGASPMSGTYVCNSALDKSRDYTILRHLLVQIAQTYFYGHDPYGLQLISHAYDLLYCIDTYHYEPLQSRYPALQNERNQARMVQILDDIHHNYASAITLQDMADAHHLSSPYLSAFFKQNMGVTFNNYVNNVRLNHAVEELIYTDKSITSITFDNGFASTNAFIKFFKEAYNTTPHQYRKEKKSQRIALAEPEINTVLELPSEEYQHVLASTRPSTYTGVNYIDYPTQEQLTINAPHSTVSVAPIWRSLLNIGTPEDLNLQYITAQLEQFQKTVGFTHARLNFVLNTPLFLQPGLSVESISFSALERAVETLRDLKLKPYFNLTIPFECLPHNSSQHLVIDFDLYMALLEHFIKFGSNLYGPDEMETWHYEISPHIFWETRCWESANTFAQRFIAAYRMIKKYLPNAAVGGCSLPAVMDNPYYETVHRLIAEAGITPDFVGVDIFPYELTRKNEENPELLHYTRNRHYARDFIHRYKQQLTNIYPSLPRVHVTSLAADCFHGHYLNDTCYQSAFMFSNTVDLIGEVDMLGYFQLSDLNSASGEELDFCSGYNGLFNKYGLRKPAAHMLDVFSHCRTNLVQKGEDYVVLKGHVDRYMIGMCNHISLNDYHCVTASSSIPIEEAYSVYDSGQTKNISVNLQNLTPGTYSTIIFQVNRAHGSLLDEWARNNYWNHFNRDELAYFHNVLQPRRTYHTYHTTDGTLHFQFQLEPHEVLFAVLLHQW